MRTWFSAEAYFDNPDFYTNWRIYRRYHRWISPASHGVSIYNWQRINLPSAFTTFLNSHDIFAGWYGPCGGCRQHRLFYIVEVSFPRWITLVNQRWISPLHMGWAFILVTAFYPTPRSLTLLFKVVSASYYATKMPKVGVEPTRRRVPMRILLRHINVR